MRALALFLALLAPLTARAQSFEKLVMPGPLSKAHADLESDCSKCHAPFKREAQAALCLACHDHANVAADLKAKTGFHGRSPAVAGSDCRACHPEHKGRDADIVALERDTFPHGFTDYALHGAHARVACEGCHPAGREFRAAPSDCFACHAADDAHHGKLGKDCASCHGETAWREARFDHDKTKFKLDGRHRDVACAQCHPGERYENTPTDCVSCHQLNDVHRGRFGSKCETCHETGRWKTRSFDHARKTSFPLTGKHATASCESCHVGGLYDRKLSTDCVSCHRGDDVHEGRNGAACQDCHTTAAWKPVRFDHDRDTKFPLRGAHHDVRCEACHTGNVHTQKLATDCVSCHQRDDVHKGQQGRDCGRCHTESGWKEKAAFDHDLARFPLLGLHAVVSCEECHATAAYRGTPRDCFSCHAKVDKHEARLGTNCERCHNPNDWKLWKFDHATQTEFPLRGAHGALACEVCHAEPVHGAIQISKSCNSCHASEDPHRGSFGASCERCHGETDWRDVRIAR